jgi:tRNA threonylcarbamoyladenosine biosynthesis protein TsaB
MNVLALDTSSPRAALALGRSDGAVFAATTEPSQRHGRALVPAVRDLLGQAEVTLADLGGIAVGLGPGSFTGLRIGLTAAKTFAYALGTPLVGFDSLEAIARSLPDVELRIAVIADAQRGDFFVAGFHREGRGAPLLRSSPTRIVSEAEWHAAAAPATRVLGPGDVPLPSAGALVELALEAVQSGRFEDPFFVEPIYLRRSAAEDLWVARREQSRP